jgi:hypothetical protein
MAIPNYSQTSNYAQTGINQKYLELYNPPVTSDNLDASRRKLIIQPKYDRRPDLLAYDLYGSARLWWVFVHYNRNIIKDPIMDFTSGKTIEVPNRFSPAGVN